MWDEKIERYQVAWYDMDHNGRCLDEDFYAPEDIKQVIEHVETVKNEDKLTRVRVFAILNDGEQYELKLEKLDKNKRYSNFYD